ncbi:DUF1774-domain-containing protein [Suhomyces tanzawaensis NRRL Y-17324]|uniref:DUF1774-domain-containing protein n=1 Tax=Suhomyces tanzawaensis NRRL Y-17324 TaxID=984487 RepID=A0A1E4SEJ8_9ASCO|nr:DUF1774-domain-containing protein [Suhomyces tanzawaensis NRRL Y-17324]ODV77935.1 DUF1774-domain-containing protein [Suhomyces tanzawaensis NRRL Y-17324]
MSSVQGTVNDITSHKVTAIVSLALSAYGNIRYLVGRSPFDHHSPFNVSNTPFSANIIVTLTYWGLLYLLQIAFVAQIFIPNLESSLRSDATKHVGKHFTVFNILSFVWSILFAKKHFFWSELILIVNLFNILALYFNHKTYSIKPWSNLVLIHASTVAFPLSWLLYAVFWNGAVLFHVHKFVGRVVSNVLIWDFLIVPGFFLVVYNDWATGFSSSILTFGLGLGQLLVKVFALQWIFAFVISAILLVLSLVAAFNGNLGRRNIELTDSEQAPLLE